MYVVVSQCMDFCRAVRIVTRFDVFFRAVRSCNILLVFCAARSHHIRGIFVMLYVVARFDIDFLRAVRSRHI